MAETTFKIGPAGSYGDVIWDQKGRTKIYQIFISYGDSQELKGIRSICFQYAEDRGSSLSEVFGSPEFCGPGFATVKLDHSDEFITGVEGYWGTNGIKELTIHTNDKSYGPFGREAVDEYDRHKFKLDIGPNNQFAGFHGTHDSFCVKSIGMYMRPTQPGRSLQSSITGGRYVGPANSNCEISFERAYLDILRSNICE